MGTGLKIAAFGAAVAATFGAAYGIGKGVGPLGDDAQPTHAAAPHKEPDPGSRTAASPAGGLQMSEAGYTLALDTPRVSPGERTALRFSIKDAQGRKVTAYEREHEKELHFIVASRDLTVFRHLHPTRAADGTWSTTADLPAAGGYRAFADFKPAKKGAQPLTLGADLAVSGTSTPQPLPAPSRTAKVDGYEVTLTGALKPNKSDTLTLKVSRNGKPVTDLQPYLGAYGHLVALRSGDLAYLHVHPHGTPGDGTTRPGPEVAFSATAPSPGTYRLFLDFRHEGTVRTAAFTVETGTSTQPQEPTPAAPGHDDTHGTTDQH
ncbi:DUF748 domain-containing protein [Streptomyces sp. NPDC087440]|uniref:DUF748 domain-containing protein n=1 Tax=Streptomyces sp. NPDC087440 TaxID=3365790 RepID=UPI0037F569FE